MEVTHLCIEKQKRKRAFSFGSSETLEGVIKCDDDRYLRLIEFRCLQMRSGVYVDVLTRLFCWFIHIDHPMDAYIYTIKEKRHKTENITA